MTARRFPPPWRAEKMPGGYVVRDSNDQAIACTGAGNFFLQEQGIFSAKQGIDRGLRPLPRIGWGSGTTLIAAQKTGRIARLGS